MQVSVGVSVKRNAEDDDGHPAPAARFQGIIFWQIFQSLFIIYSFKGSSEKNEREYNKKGPQRKEKYSRFLTKMAVGSATSSKMCIIANLLDGRPIFRP